uniref:tRNA pseudouridine synthase n=3 Tax=Chrysotila carterae TaxID=13221 RepID=A0A6S9U5H5_CHRCT
MASAQSTVESGCCRIRYLLLIEYVGTAFHGSQRQPGKRTVQELVEDAAAKLTPHSVPPTVVFAGRTDAGVHSIANAAHVDLERLDKHGNRLPAFSEGELMNALNNFVGERCGIVSARRVHKGFHARHSARVRTYVYQIRCPKSPREARAQALLRVDCCGSLMRRGWVSAHDAHRSLWLAEPLDLNAMRDAAALLVGKHDFSAFRAVRCGAKSPVRDLLELAVVEDSPSTLAEFDLECTRRVALRLRARSFLHHQVRYIAATLVEVGLGKRSLQQVRDMLRSADSRQSPPCAPFAPLRGSCSSLLLVGVASKRR